MMKRRQFMGYTVCTLALQGIPALSAARAWVPDFSAIQLQATGLSAAQWRLLGQVQVHLFPSESQAPGAREINALPYLQWVLSDPGLEPANRDFFARGVARLQALSRAETGVPFADLDHARREQVLRSLERESEGRKWITELLHYLFEAALTDPVYGGNPGGIGWQWLKHQPGFRRPDADTRYFML